MNPDGQLPDRVERLEQQMAEVRETLSENTVDASAARVLASHADRDTGDLRAELTAHRKVFHALRETQLDQGRVLNEHSVILGEQTSLLNEHSVILGEHGRVLGTVQVGMEHLIRLLTPPDD